VALLEKAERHLGRTVASLDALGDEHCWAAAAAALPAPAETSHPTANPGDGSESGNGIPTKKSLTPSSKRAHRLRTTMVAFQQPVVNQATRRMLKLHRN
jgi:hypothetical protein